MLNRWVLRWVSEDSYGRCGSDKLRQTVPDASSGDRKSSVTDGRQSGAADDQSVTRMNWNGVADEPRHLPPDKAHR